MQKLSYRECYFTPSKSSCSERPFSTEKIHGAFSKSVNKKLQEIEKHYQKQEKRFKNEYKQEYFTHNGSSVNQLSQKIEIAQLQQQIKKENQKFSKKELTLQEQLLQFQKESEKMIRLSKTKYEIIVCGLKSELKIKDEEIYSLNLKIRQTELPQNFSKKCRSKNSGEEVETLRTSTQHKHSQSSCNENNKLIEIYNQKVDQLKIQTVDFVKKFENEKKEIKQEMNLLKNQKELLQSLWASKQQSLTERKTTKSDRGDSFSVVNSQPYSRKQFQF